MKYFLTFTFFVLTFSSVNAQNINVEKQLDFFTEKAIEYFYSNQDSAYYYFEKLNKIVTDQNDWEKNIDYLSAWNKSARYFYDLEKIKTNLTLLDSIFNTHQKKLDTLSNYLYYKNSVLYDKGNYYFELSDFKKSRNAFQEIINTTEELPDSLLTDENIDLLSVSYRYIAKMNSDEGKYDLAKEFYHKDIRFISSKKPDDKKSINNNYSLLAEVYRREKKYKESNRFFLKSLKYFMATRDKNSIISVALYLAQNYNSLSQLDSANYYLGISKNNLTENHAFNAFYHEIKAETYQKSNKYELALDEFKKSLLLEKQKWGNKKHPYLAQVYNKMGLLHASFDQPSKALENYNFGIFQLSGENSNRTTLLKILNNKAAVLNTISSDNQFRETIKTVDFGVKTLDTLKPGFKSESDKLLLIEEAFPLFESGLEASYNLYQTTQKDKFIDKAFFYAEKSKSVLLLEALLNMKATKFGKIPENLLETERQLKSSISYLEKEINQSKDEKIILELQDNLFKVKSEYRTLIDDIENNYKSYYNLKYNTHVASISQIQKLLEDDEMLVSYFYGNKNIYIISVTNGTKHFQKIKIDTTLGLKINKVYNMLNNPSSDIKLLGNLTNDIYTSLLKASIEANHNNRLIIIADGLLNYIPFSSINTNPNGINYLIEKKAISYAHSATLFAELKQSKSLNNTVLAFAPSFDDNFEANNERSTILLPLSNNVKEVEQILTHFKGNSFISKNASLKNFTDQIFNYGIIHLATHAILNDELPEYSYLAFTPKKNEESLLYVSDLYNMQFDANLITLSACETGIGDLKKGEGFISLSRGFFYGGASSILNTIWKINDASSSILMNNFYKHLSKGNHKDIALQKAKLEFLKANKQNALSHPYYWSGFVLTGNSNAITQQSFSLWLWGFIGILFIVLIFYLVSKRKSV